MSNKKKKSNGRQDGGFMFFVPDQGEGAARRYSASASEFSVLSASG